MQQMRIYKKLIFVLLPLFIIAGTWFFRYRQVRNELCSVEQVHEDKLSLPDISKSREKNLYFEGIPLPHDEESGIYYLSSDASTDYFAGELTSDSGIRLFAEADDGITEKAGAIAENHVFRLYAADEMSCEEKKITFTTLPVIAVNTAEELFEEYQEGSVDSFEGMRAGRYNADVKVGESGNVITISLSNRSALVSSGESRKWKAARVRDKDLTFVRQCLAAEAWSVFSQEEGNGGKGGLAEVIENNIYKGLYYIFPADDDGKEYADGLENCRAVNLPGYLAFLQFAYARENLSELTNYSGSLNGEYTVQPKRVDYSFGILPTRMGWYSYRGQSRILSRGQLGIEGDERLIEAVRESWDAGRKQLTNDYMCYITDMYTSKIKESGYELRSRRFEDAESYDMAVDELKQYLTQRLPFVDSYYRGEIDEFGMSLADSRTASAGNEAGEAPRVPEPDRNSEYKGYIGVSAVVSGGENIELYARDGVCYALLPSYAQSDELTLRADMSEYAVWIDGRAADDGCSLTDAKEIALAGDKASDSGYSGKYSFRIVRSGKLPTIYIDTFNGTMDYVNEVKGNKEPGEARVLSPDGETLIDASFSYIKFRGHGTSGQSKKTYRIAFEQEQDILGMGGAKEWILQANAVDASKVRNALAYEMADRIGIPYVTDYRYADVYFNGRYGGNYLILEPVEAGEHRAAIDTAAGSVLFENMNKESRLSEDDIVLTGDDGFIITVKDPKDISKDHLAKMQNTIREVNECLLNVKTDEDYVKLSEKIDIRSFALTYIMDMVCNDIDSGYFSTFFFYNAGDGKLYAGPVWDYDKSFGGQKDRGQLIRLNAFYCTWPEVMAQIPGFRDEVAELLRGETSEIIREMSSKWLPETCELIADSYEMDRVRWPNISKTVIDRGSLIENRDYVSDCLLKRLSLLTDITLEPDRYHRVYIGDSMGRIYYAKDNETISQEDIEYICKMYECNALLTKEGSVLTDKDRITKDMLLYPEGDNNE